MSRLPLALALLAACDADLGQVALSPVGSSARLLEPGCAGSGYATIQAAIDAAVSGDVLEICAGTYAERLVVSGKALTIVAKPEAVVVVDAQGAGKALSVTNGADVTIERLTLRNGSGGNGGDVSCVSSALDLVASRLEDGVATNGGGLYVSGCTGTASGTTFEGNAATTGGGAYVTGDGFGFETCSFLGNDATDRGGGLRLRGDGVIREGVFQANHANIGGGAYVAENDTTIEDNWLEANTADADGGGIFVEWGQPTVSGNTFLDNDAGDEGGGLRVKTASPTIVGNSFVHNHADWRGGGSRISHDEAVLSGNTWSDNSASRGGALMLFESASTLTDETFVDNTADRGGALYVEAGWDGPVVTDSTFDGNRAWLQGGHVYVNLPNETTTLVRVDLVNGNADVGAALYAVGSTLDLRNVLVANNRADVASGGLHLDATGGTVRNVVAWANVGADGAALTVDNGAALDVANSTFGRNSGSAAIDVNSGVAPTVRYSSFNGNASNVTGMPGPVGRDGNVSVNPRFSAPRSGDFTLQPGSPLVDAGDPAIPDVDGSRSDIGLYGGPDAF